MTKRIAVALVMLVHCVIVHSRSLQQSHFAFLALGDYGGLSAQYNVATQLIKWKDRVGAGLVVSVGDNFYPSGVWSTSDGQWNDKWYKVYKERSGSMRDVPWHAILGNHDYCGDTKAQIDYKQNGWRMDDVHWVYRFNSGGQKIAFVYIDTNLLAYGVDTQDWLRKECGNMQRYFKQQGWSQDGHLAWIRKLLDSVQDADWILVIGHHQVGGGHCATEGRLGELMPMFRDKRVSAYLHGHVHSLGYGSVDGVSHVLTGAGGDTSRNMCKSRWGGSGGQWYVEKVGGFVSAQLSSSELVFIFVDENGKELYTARQQRR